MTDEIDQIQIGGTHYKTDDPAAQHWNVMLACKANYFQGVITKYIDRYRKKNGLQDLEKALHYAEKYAGNEYTPYWSEKIEFMAPLLEKHGIDSLESNAIYNVMHSNMLWAIELIKQLIENYKVEEAGARYVNQD